MRVLLSEVGNASPGDEAICIAAARRLRDMGCELVVAWRVNLRPSFEAAGITAEHVPVPLLPLRRTDIDSPQSLVEAAEAEQPQAVATLRQALGTVDCLCVAPGGKYIDGLDNRRALISSAVARTQGVPVIVLHQSIGPISAPSDRSLIRQVFGDAALVVLRDHKSFTLMGELDLDPQRLQLASDAALSESYPSDADEEPYALGLNLRFSPNGHWSFEGVRALLEAFCRVRPSKRVHLYSTTTSIPEDIQRLATGLGVTTTTEWVRHPHYVSFIGGCAINVADSFHGVLFSMKAGRPVICLQPGLRTWKLHGLTPPESEPLTIHPGPTDDECAATILAAILRLLDSAAEQQRVLQEQDRLIRRGRRLAESGWNRVRACLEGRSATQPGSS